MGNHGNRKVVYKGILFDSVLERNAYRRLEFLNVDFTYHKTTYKILTGYKVKSWSSKTKRFYISKISDRHYTPEFIIKDRGREIIIEMKGFRTAVFNLKWDLFRKNLKENQEAYLIKTIPDLTLLIQALKIKSNIKPQIKL